MSNNQMNAIFTAPITDWTFPLSSARISLSRIENLQKLLLMSLTPDWSKEDYLKWVKEWKETYAKLSIASRTAKKYRKQTNIAAVKRTKPFEEGEIEKIALMRTGDVKGLKVEATELLHLRKISKVLAHASFLKNVRRVNA